MAAKKAFDELGVQKLPWVKELQSEYAVLLAEKKKAYAEYQQVRQEMQEILTAKANVERLLGRRNRIPKRKKNMASDELVMFQKRSQNAQPQNEILCSKGA